MWLKRRKLRGGGAYCTAVRLLQRLSRMTGGVSTKLNRSIESVVLVEKRHQIQVYPLRLRSVISSHLYFYESEYNISLACDKHSSSYHRTLWGSAYGRLCVCALRCVHYRVGSTQTCSQRVRSRRACSSLSIDFIPHMTYSSLKILKPILHSLLIPGTLTFLSVASNRRMKAPAFRVIGAYVTKVSDNVSSLL